MDTWPEVLLPVVSEGDATADPVALVASPLAVVPEAQPLKARPAIIADASANFWKDFN